LARLLRWRHAERTVYVAGSFASREPLYGVSDLDLIVVTPTSPGSAPGAERDLARARWRQLSNRLRIPKGPLQVVAHEQGALAAAAADTTYTYGLGRPIGTEPALYHGAGTIWRTGGGGLFHGPGPFGAAAPWRRLAGPERRPAKRALAEAERPLVAWLSLQSWWRRAFDACLDPGAPHISYLCVKLTAESLRLLRWLETGELVEGRTTPLRLTARTDPRFEAPARRALDLYRALPESPPAPLARGLQDFVELSNAVAEAVNEAAFAAGSTRVLLSGAGEELIGPSRAGCDGLLPLADWRALCYWFPPDEALMPLTGDPASPDDVADAARMDDGHRCPALVHESILVQPTTARHARGLLRAAQCAASDPVSLALLGGAESAAFPQLAGWSVEDWARRACAEHRAWLLDREASGEAEAPDGSLAKLLSAARAALLLRSVMEGSPRLPLTASATVDALADAAPQASATAEDALACYREWSLSEAAVPAAVSHAFRSTVCSLRAYREPLSRPAEAVASDAAIELVSG
jgi:hypothetical protein